MSKNRKSDPVGRMPKIAEEIIDDIELIKQNFDKDYYLRRNLDVAIAGIDPLWHFCLHGWREMRDPNPNFSILYYLNANPDVRKYDRNPFLHYLVTGRQEGRKGKLWHDSTDINEDNKHFLEEEKTAVEHAFDADYYLMRYPDVADRGHEPLDHYMRFGWKEGRDPTATFSTSFYLEAYPDIKAANVDPFWHFVVAGENEGRDAFPIELEEIEAEQAFEEINGMTNTISELSDVSSINDAIIEVLKPHFDENYYTQNYSVVQQSELQPLVHFCIDGWRSRLDPSPDFSVAGYLELHSDVAEGGVNPFWHYIVTGRDEGRRVMTVDEYHARKTDTINTDIEAIKLDFDSAFYAFKYPDVMAAGVNPLDHYWNSGWKEGRDPCATFSTTFYLETNPDVADLGINPFWHYVVAGKNEGRVAQHPGGYRVERLRHLDTLDEEVRHWIHTRAPSKLLKSRELVSCIREARKDSASALILSVGHDHYHKVSGGIQLCINREEAISDKCGHVYLNLHPWQALPRLAHLEDSEDPIICLLINGVDVGECRISELVRAVTRLRRNFANVEVVIHQLLGHLPERIIDLIKATGRKECWHWLHDFITICPSFTLQRNGVSFCGAPPPESNACNLCRYGVERRNNRHRVAKLFEEINVHVLSPSQVTAKTWKERSGLTPASLRVMPHMTLTWRKRKRASARPKVPPPITVGFLGTPASHKGWNVFETLFRSISSIEGYRFVYLGASDLPANGIDHRRVHVTAHEPDAMIKAVRREKVDLVLHWASWPETFSLSTYEAYAGGAYVITNGISGNVAATVEHLNRGAVLSDENELSAFFENGRAETMVDLLREERRKFEVVSQLSRMVHDAMDQAEKVVRL